MSEGVFQDGSNNPTGRNRPLLPPNPNGLDERPHLPPTPPVQLDNLPSSVQPEDPWGQVVAGWTNAPAQVAVDMVSVWTALMGWGTPLPGASTVEGFEPLVATAPSVLLDNFEGWYSNCPLVS